MVYSHKPRLKKLSLTFRRFITVFTLCACAPGVTDPTYVSSSYTRGDLSGVAAQGGLPAFVTGAPFGANQQAQILDVVESAFSGAHFGPQFSVEAQTHGYQANSPNRAYNLFVILQATSRGGAAQICQGKQPTTNENQTGLSVKVVFCRYRQVMTHTHGTLSEKPTGPNDPVFEDFLRSISVQIFPPAGERDIEGARDTFDNNSREPIWVIPGS